MTTRITRRRALELSLFGAAGTALVGCRRKGDRLTCRTLAECGGAPAGPARGDVKIAFGSCNKVDRPQPLWESILSLGADLWLWVGDSVYADTEDVGKMRAFYRAQAAQPDYARLARSTPVAGTWDDHDYGVNDGGSEYPSRAASQQAYLDFIGEPAESARRRRAGVYTSLVLGDGPRSVKLILLDVRYHRDRPGPDGDMLGAEQWAWLEAELRGSDSAVHLIGSGTQVIAEQHRFEKWANFPKSRARLFRLIRETAAPGVILLSGDRHMAELCRLEEDPLRYPLWELTSSGLTHYRAEVEEPNRHRVGPELVALNFGLVEVDWADGGEVRLAAIDLRGGRRIAQRIPLASLAARH